MSALAASQTSGINNGAASPIPSAFENDHVLSATEAVMWIVCQRRFSHDKILEHIRRRKRGQVSPALFRRTEEAGCQVIGLIIGGVPATGTLVDEGHTDHGRRVPIPPEFLKDGAFIELLSSHILADPLLEKHWAYERLAYHHVNIDRDAFFNALSAAEPKAGTDRETGEEERHVLTDDERVNGGMRFKWDKALQNVVNNICELIRENGHRPTLGTFEKWLVDNASPHDPYESGVLDCDDIYIEDSRISWTDSAGDASHSKSLRSLERYIYRAR